MNRDDWKALGATVVDWANTHPGVTRDLTCFFIGVIVGAILF